MKKQIGFCILTLGLLTTSAFGGTGTQTPVYINHKPDPDQSEVGEVYVSIVGIRPLDAVIDEIQPQFNITAQDAFQKAVPDTLTSSEFTLSSLNAAVQIGLMLTPSGGATSPTNPAIIGQPLTPLNALTNLSPSALGIDPISQYQSAASLFEQVKLLNRSLKDVPNFGKSYIPYVVTIQVSLIPHRRIAPYDAYADVTFFGDPSLPPDFPTIANETVPFVFPLISDDLEGASSQEGVDRLRELGFALAAAYHGIGGQFSVNQLNQNLEAISGNSLNSLLTIGKMNANTVVIRLGARNQASLTNRLNMVPETHTIALLVIAQKSAKELQLVSRTTLRKVDDGKELNERSFDDVTSKFADLLVGYGFFDSQRTIEKLRKGSDGEEKFEDFEQRLMNDVFDNPKNGNSKMSRDIFAYFEDDQNFTNTFCEKDYDSIYHHFSHTIATFDVIDYDSLWLDVAKLGGTGGQYASDLVRLPYREPELPATDLTMFYKDDGQSTIFTISGSHRLATSKLHATLTCTNGAKFHSDLVDVADNGTTLNIHFPSVSMLGADPNAFKPQAMSLYLEEDGEISHQSNYPSLFPMRKTPSAPGSESYPWQIARTHGGLIAGVTNQFSIVLVGKAAGTTNVNYLDVASAFVVTNTPTALFEKSKGGIYRLKPTNDLDEITFTLAPLPAGQSVDFNLLDNKEKVVSTLNHQVVQPVAGQSK